MGVKLYRITNWSDLYENNRTRELKTLAWLPIPNSHDGDGYTLLMEQKNGESLFGAWVVILQVASKCDPRGTLMRDGARPHSPASLARMTRFSVETITQCLTVLSNPEIGWISLSEIDSYEEPAVSCGNPADECDETAAVCLERKKERKKEERPFLDDAKVILAHLNIQSRSSYREVESNLSLIAARLQSTGGDVDGIRQMIERQCKLWLGDAKMENYLQPSTLFGKEKFEQYYGQRDKQAVAPMRNGVTSSFGEVRGADKVAMMEPWRERPAPVREEKE